MSTCGNAELIEHINKHAKYMLFMSVDIIDSTKTKQEIAKRNDKRTTTSDNYEVWIESFEQFFEDFQSDFKECLENSSFFNAADNVDIKIINKPNLWKCNGDEMIFCVQVTNHIHVPYYLDSFKRAIENHHVSKDKKLNLLLKATAWGAGFPVNNSKITTKIPFDKNKIFDEDENKKEIEISCTKTEGRGKAKKTQNIACFYHVDDYIGPSMDIGFRLTGLSNRHSFVISDSIAIMLLKSKKTTDRFRIHFGGLVKLKGLGEKEYPHLWIDMQMGDEDDLSKLIHKSPANTKDLLKYLETQKGKTKLPFIAGDEQFSSNPTDSYKKVYARRFMQDTQEPHGGTREINKNEFPSMLEA